MYIINSMQVWGELRSHIGFAMGETAESPTRGVMKMTVVMGDATMKTMIKIVVVEILTMAKIMTHSLLGVVKNNKREADILTTKQILMLAVLVRRTGYLSLGHASHRQLNPCRNEAPGKDAKWRNSGD